MMEVKGGEQGGRKNKEPEKPREQKGKCVQARVCESSKRVDKKKERSRKNLRRL
jgi:hypothetical protein